MSQMFPVTHGSQQRVSLSPRRFAVPHGQLHSAPGCVSQAVDAEAGRVLHHQSLHQRPRDDAHLVSFSDTVVLFAQVCHNVKNVGWLAPGFVNCGSIFSSPVNRWLFGEITCQLYAMCGVLFGLCSLANLTALSLVCCLKVCFPNHGEVPKNSTQGHRDLGGRGYDTSVKFHLLS